MTALFFSAGVVITGLKDPRELKLEDIINDTRPGHHETALVPLNAPGIQLAIDEWLREQSGDLPPARRDVIYFTPDNSRTPLVNISVTTDAPIEPSLIRYTFGLLGEERGQSCLDGTSGMDSAAELVHGETNIPDGIYTSQGIRTGGYHYQEFNDNNKPASYYRTDSSGSTVDISPDEFQQVVEQCTMRPGPESR